MKEKQTSGLSGVRVGLIAVSVAVVFALVGFIALKPDTTIPAIMNFKTSVLAFTSPFVELFAFGCFLIALYIAFGKYKNVKLGEGEPEYSTFSYVAMMFMASMASAAVYWAFTEWAHYYVAPGLGIEPESAQALEIAIGYQFFHWGIPNAVYFVCALAFAYGYYIRKVDILQPRSVIERMLGNFRYKHAASSLIDFIIVFATIGGMGVTLGTAIPLVGGALTQIFGIDVTFLIQVLIIVVITLIFSFTSSLGTAKGMQVVSNGSAYICFAILAFVLVAGNTEFILKNTVSSLGYFLSDLIPMSFFTDPIHNTGFAESWTVFFIAFFTSYGGLMGVFIAKISKGRTLGQMAICSVGGLILGAILLFGVLGSYSIETFISGAADPIEIIHSNQGEAGIFQIVATLPGGDKIVPFALLIMALGFVVSSLDTASLSLAQTTTKVVDAEGNASMKLRLFWCLIIGLVPLAIMFTNSGFDPIKTIAILATTPFMLVIIFMAIRVFQWMREDSENGVLDANRAMYEAELAAKKAAKAAVKAPETVPALAEEEPAAE